jgi:hypothetical protein
MHFLIGRPNLNFITTQIGKTFVLSIPCPRPEMPD